MVITKADLDAQYAMLKRGEEIQKAARQAEERERLRDTFATAALTGLLHGIPDGTDIEAGAAAAYSVAEAMLRERERRFDAQPRTLSDDQKTLRNAADILGPGGFRELAKHLLSLGRRIANHDAVPEAKAMQSRDCSGVLSGTGDTPSEAEIDALEFVVITGGIANGWDKGILRQWLVRLRPESDRSEPIKEGESDRSQPIGSPAKTNPTQPRDGTPAEGSVPGEGSVPDSRSENEPVAWAVMQNDWYHDAHLDYYKAVKLATAANVAGAKNPWNVVPLYRHPPCQDSSQKNFTLTDEEREAIAGAADLLIGSKPGATLRNLLERLHT